MLKDITLGQYFPGNSPLHRIHATVKILLSLAYVVLVFLVKNYTGYAVLAAFTFGFIALSRVPLSFIIKGLKPVLVFIVFTAVMNAFMTGTTIIWQLGFLKLTYEGLHYAGFMVLRIVFMVTGTSMLTYTTSPIALTDGIESLLKPFARFGVPAHELAMMMTIALRFIPTLLEEADKIIKAQMSRGADFESGNLLSRAKALLPLLVPLFVSAFRRADELAVAMEGRCYRGGTGRTRLHETKPGRIDLYASGILLVFGILLLEVTTCKTLF
jgi:energy-coupling factor transport system permease protein